MNTSCFSKLHTDELSIDVKHILDRCDEYINKKCNSREWLGKLIISKLS